MDNKNDNAQQTEDLWKPSKQNLRIREILFKLKSEKIVTVKDLAEAFNVTKMTIYRDVNTLQQNGLVTFINGVLVYNERAEERENQGRTDITYDLPTEIHRNTEEKKRIVRRAVELLEDEDTIYIDSGSTMELLSREIPENRDLVVGCHAFYVLVNIQMKKGCDIIFPGGYFHPDTFVFESEESVQFIKKNRINKAFFAAGGVNAELGVTCANPFVVNIKRAILETSHTKILLVDSSKFNTVKKVYYADLNEFDAVITDGAIPSEYRKLIEEAGLELYIA
jgi:DeoR family transcriptional regulator, deoxyribose operon repressor